ncbi:MAG TPA: tRNA dihydrouridine synthase DusB [Sorangium sp.]|nr:tRNA dihydrouridine synthase DusB [Sorangium sp.]
MSAPPKKSFDALFANSPVILAPMEDVTDEVYRRLCRELGADLCVTEFVNVEGLLRGCKKAARKITLAPHDQPTAIQIYGSDPTRLAEAAQVAAAAEPAFIDINCGCWVPKIARRGAGAGWLRDPDAMVRMAEMVVNSVSLPVTVKTRIGYHKGKDMPIVALTRRMEAVGVRMVTIHCRTAKAGHNGPAHWHWAQQAQAAVSIPVIVNGDIRCAQDAKRALAETGCAGVMVGRRAIEHPWIFREARALLDHGKEIAPPTLAERLQLARKLLRESVALRGQPRGVYCTRRFLSGYLRGLRGAASLRRELFQLETLDESLALLHRYEGQMAAA